MKPRVTIVIFGATGDLANRKLYPSIYHLYKKGKIGEEFAVIGLARRPWDDDILKQRVKEAIQDEQLTAEELDRFTSHFYYRSFDVTDESSFQQLHELLSGVEEEHNTGGNRIFYLAMAPQFFGTIASNLKKYKLKDTPGWTRLVIEKPFGRDLKSAQALNEQIRESFDEEQIYRIDHYLGKQMVQNIEVIRFANGIFEHLWNNQFISNVQITSSETLGVEDRARYYDESGATRDMLQNHMLQMVALLAMEPPIKLSTDEIRSEKIKVLRALRPVNINEVNTFFVRGQYGAGEVNGEVVSGYREEDPVLTHSNTETFVAGKLLIDSYRWAGVPFYIRTGKRLAEKSTRIVIQFKDLPMNLYYKTDKERQPNLLIIHIQPNEGVTLYLNTKKSGAGSLAEPVKLSYNQSEVPGINTPEAYEKLLYDCMLGDMTNFTHWDEVSLSWQFVDNILEKWSMQEADFPNYKAGTMGPHAADRLLAKDGFHWWDM